MILGKKAFIKFVRKYFCNFWDTIKEQPVVSFSQLTSIMFLTLCLATAAHILVSSDATSLRKY